MPRRIVSLVVVVLLLLASTLDCVAEELRPRPLKSQVTSVQPMTGIVLWSTNAHVRTAPIQLEYSYVGYDKIVSAKGEYNWNAIEEILQGAASRGHQAIIRLHDTYVAQPTTVPAYIKALPDYKETIADSEKKQTGFPDWSHSELQRFVLEFFTQFAKKYDHDPRLAYLQVGFGLWAEYHIYDGPLKLGQTFPSLKYQTEFLQHMSREFQQTPWMISVDAAGDHTPLAEDLSLLKLPFGVFDDSFNHARHKQENEPNWKHLGLDRWKIAPGGGEFSFFEDRDQSHALVPRGPHKIPFELHAAKFHISFMIGDDQPRFQTPERLRQAGMACGYRFRVTSFAASSSQARVTVENRGIAPIYYDAFPALNGTRSTTSLKGLLPGESRVCEIPTGGTDLKLSIECDRLVPGQTIQYEAELP